MPYSDKGKPAVTIYSYTRTDGTANFGLDGKKVPICQLRNIRQRLSVGKNDTKWIGVSKALLKQAEPK